MYVLEIKNKNKKGRNGINNFRSFENFEFLMSKKNELEKVGNICLVYKISNNGREVTRLTDRNEYRVVTDYDKELRKGFKQYKSICDLLLKCGERNFYVENDILYIKSEDNIIEVEMVRKTPRYTIKINGELVADKETSQEDIIDKLFTNTRKRIRKSFKCVKFKLYYS